MSDLLISPSSLQNSPRAESVRGTYFVQTWGCQMNEEDSEQIQASLEQIGFTPADSPRHAHVIILNTCSVRRKPEDKAFSFLGQLGVQKRNRPDMIIGVAGCMAQIRAKEIRQKAPHVDFVIGTAQLAQIPGLVEEALQRRKFQARLALPERRGAVVTDIPVRAVRSAAKLKAFIPIQYGCDKFCTYCIVPTTRGRERSRPAEEIVEEATKLAALGTREVTLLGQTVNSYGKNLAEGRVSFARLLWMLNEVPNLMRVRYVSPYPRDFKTDLIQTIKDCPVVMEHVHMPLQSGSNEVLRKMKRVYTVAEFEAILTELRQTMPQVKITTDMIVGFPGETDELFEETMEVMRRIRFYGAYMFAYSPRPGTSAAGLDQVPESVKRDRLNALIDLQTKITVEENERAVGDVLEVLVEGPSQKNPGLLQGYSREYQMVHFSGKDELRGEIVHVKATTAHKWGVSGELI